MFAFYIDLALRPRGRKLAKRLFVLFFFVFFCINTCLWRNHLNPLTFVYSSSRDEVYSTKSSDFAKKDHLREREIHKRMWEFYFQVKRKWNIYYPGKLKYSLRIEIYIKKLKDLAPSIWMWLKSEITRRRFAMFFILYIIILI